jgi:tetratricopeptide (TPR) repeat protein
VDAVALARTGSIKGLPHVITAQASRTNHKIENRFWTDLDRVVQQAAQAHRDGNLPKTRNLLSRVLAASSSSPTYIPTFEVAEAWHQSALVELLTNHPRDALMDITKAIRFRPNTALYYGNAVHILQALGMLDEAIKSSSMAVRLDALSVLESAQQTVPKHDNICGHVQAFTHLLASTNAPLPTLALMQLFSLAHPAVELVCMNTRLAIVYSFLETWVDMARRFMDKQVMIPGLKQGQFENAARKSMEIAPDIAVQVMQRIVVLRSKDPRILLKYGVILHEAGHFGLALDAHVNAVRIEHAIDFNTNGGQALWQKHESQFGLDGSNKPVLAIYCYEYGQTWWPNWGPKSPDNGGAGGSEEAVIFIARELVSRFRVQVSSCIVRLLLLLIVLVMMTNMWGLP